MTLSLLPQLSDYLLEALPNPCFRSSAIDEFLTTVGMDADYTGESDFGTATLLELDDEDRTALALIWALHYEENPSADQWSDAAACIVYGRDNAWFGDAVFFPSIDEARAAYEAFDNAYSEWLGCEDCGAETGSACTCDFDPSAGPIAVGTVVSVANHGGVAWRVDAYTVDGSVTCHMVGDDRPFTFGIADLSPLADDAYCQGCGQTGCTAEVSE